MQAAAADHRLRQREKDEADRRIVYRQRNAHTGPQRQLRCG